MFFASYDETSDPRTSKPRGWRVQFEGEVMRLDICGAINEQVARETAALMQSSRFTHYGTRAA